MQGIYDSANMKRRQGIGDDVGEGMRGSHVTLPAVYLRSYRQNEVIVIEHFRVPVDISIAQALSIYL